MTINKQPKEMLTIKELSEIFGISRQAIRKHVDNLETTYLAKNNQGYKTVLWSGVLQLADKLGQPELFQKTTIDQEILDISNDLPLTTELLAQLQQKDTQIEQLQALLVQQQKLLDQQQQLTLQANQQIEKLQEQIQLTYEETVENETEPVHEENESSNERSTEKKWWQIWKQ